MPSVGKDELSAAAVAAAEATKEAARIQRAGAIQAARIAKSGGVAQAKINAASAIGVAAIAGAFLVINTSVQGCYSLRQAEVAARTRAPANSLTIASPQVWTMTQGTTDTASVQANSRYLELTARKSELELDRLFRYHGMQADAAEFEPTNFIGPTTRKPHRLSGPAQRFA